LAPVLTSVRSVEYTSESVWLRTSISCLRLRVLAEFASASFTIRSISSLVGPDDAVMVMFCCLPVACPARRVQDAVRVDVDVTSICGT